MNPGKRCRDCAHLSIPIGPDGAPMEWPPDTVVPAFRCLAPDPPRDCFPMSVQRAPGFEWPLRRRFMRADTPAILCPTFTPRERPTEEDPR